METKACSKCREVQPIAEFRIRHDKPSGPFRDSWCYGCYRAWNSARPPRRSTKPPVFANPEQTRRLRNSKVTAKERGAECETIRVADWCAKLDHYEWRCAYCLGPYEQIEHVIAITDGGPHSLDNIVPACAECNSGKNGGGSFVPHVASEFWPALPEMLYASTVRSERLPRRALRAA